MRIHARLVYHAVASIYYPGKKMSLYIQTLLDEGIIRRILLQAFFTLAGILVETAETYYGCLQNDVATNW